MNSLNRAISQVHRLDDLAAGDTVLHRLPPVAKLLAVLVYLVFLMSFRRYDLPGVLSLSAVLFVLYPLGGLPLKGALQEIRHVILFLAGLGMVNAFLGSSVSVQVGGMVLPGSLLLFGVLVLKGILSCLMVLLLLATTRMEDVCTSLITLHVPKLLAVTLLLLVRYLVLLLQEGRRMSTAYALRAPDHKGIPPRLWGSLLGMWFLRSLDRAQRVYEAMTLRGFSGYFPRRKYSEKDRRRGIILLLAIFIYCLACRLLLG